MTRPVPDQARAGPILNTRPDLLATLTEKEWQAQVMAWAHRSGWRLYHVHDSRRTHPGFPDLVLVKRSRLLFVELKREKGRLTKMQDAWLDDLRGTCVEVYVWRPSDEADVQRLLSDTPAGSAQEGGA